MTFYKTEIEYLPSTEGEFWSIKKLEKYLLKNSEDGVPKVGKIPRNTEVKITIRYWNCNIFGVAINYNDAEYDGKDINEVVIVYDYNKKAEIKIHLHKWDTKYYRFSSQIKIDFTQTDM